MVVYTLLFLVVFILRKKIKKNKFYIRDYILLAVLILFSGLRVCGVDYFLYRVIYRNGFELTSRTGIGFTYLMYFFKSVLKLDYQYLIFFVSTLTNVCVYFFIKKKSNNPGLSILLYVCLGFYTTSFNMFRQMFSFSLVLFGSCFGNKKNITIRIISYIMAFFVHSSSLIGIAGYTIFEIFKEKKLSARLVVFVAVIATLLYGVIFPFAISLVNGYDMYLTYDSIPGIGTWLNVFVYYILTFVFILPVCDKLEKRNKKKDYQFRNLFLVGVGIMMLELKNFLFFRIAFYFIPLAILLLPDFYEFKGLKSRKVHKFMFYACLYVYFIVYVCSFDGVMPYRMVFIQ